MADVRMFSYKSTNQSTETFHDKKQGHFQRTGRDQCFVRLRTNNPALDPSEFGRNPNSNPSPSRAGMATGPNR